MAGFNAMGQFFGIGQTKLPREFFSRCILLLFIWFCLMFRTCYQSMMFEFITSDMRKPTPETFEDLVKYNYTIVGSSTIEGELLYRIAGYLDLWNRIENENKEIIWEHPDDIPEIYAKVLNGSLKKFAFLVSDTTHNRLNKTFDTSLPIMQEERSSSGISIKFSSPIFHEFHRREAFRLVASGIPKFLHEHGTWSVYRPVEEEIEDPRKVLTIQILEFGFVVWLIAVVPAIFVFFCEVLFTFLKRKIINLAGLIEFLKLLRAKLENYHDVW